MRRSRERRAATMSVLCVLALLTIGPLPSASAQEDADAADDGARLPAAWLDRIDPWNGIPQGLARDFGEAALSVGLTSSQAARLLNDHRFVMALGSPMQGWGLLEAMIDDPGSIAEAWEIRAREGQRLTSAGTSSFQSAIFERRPELRNGYLADFGLLIAARADGIEVLVDLETGRQYLGDDQLGTAVTAPGGGPLPTPAIPPEEVAAQMWVDAGADPGDPDPGDTALRGNTALAEPQLPTGPGLNVRTDETSRRALWAAYLVGAAFLFAWGGYAVIAIARRARRTER